MSEIGNINENIISEAQHAELTRYAELTRAMKKRSETPAPNVTAEWATFSSNNSIKTPAKSHKIINLRTLRDIAIGAVAMFAVMLTYNHYFNKNVTIIKEKMVTAKHYDKAPKSVTLQQNNKKQTIASRDSISFIVAANNHPTPDENNVITQQKATPLVVNMQKLSTPRGMDFKVLLPDGSEVWLNAESTIEFPSAFIGEERIVKLKGEAYFKVAHNEQQPFVVNTEKVSVKVLGTEFNFKSYKEEIPHVSLVKGKVDVMQGNDDNTVTQLRPGQDAWLDSKGAMHVREIDTYTVTQWIRGLFYFDDAPLVDILRDLSRWYNCGVVFNNKSSMNYRLHFSASRNVSLNQTIENLNRLCKSKITIEGDNLVVN